MILTPRTLPSLGLGRQFFASYMNVTPFLQFGVFIVGAVCKMADVKDSKLRVLTLNCWYC